MVCSWISALQEQLPRTLEVRNSVESVPQLSLSLFGNPLAHLVGDKWVRSDWCPKNFDSCWLPCFGADLLNVLWNNGTPVPRPRLALVKTNASDAPQSGLEETVQSVHSVRLAEDVHIVEERAQRVPRPAVAQGDVPTRPVSRLRTTGA